MIVINDTLSNIKKTLEIEGFKRTKSRRYRRFEKQVKDKYGDYIKGVEIETYNDKYILSCYVSYILTQDNRIYSLTSNHSRLRETQSEIKGLFDKKGNF